MKYLRLEKNIVTEIIPEFNPLFPNVPVEERYPREFVKKLVAVNDDINVHTGMIKTDEGFSFPTNNFTAYSLKELINKKIAEFSDECNKRIITGIELNGRHYSMSVTDQLNMTVLRTEIMDGAETVAYHANGAAFELYTKEQFMEIYHACQKHRIKENTYFNQLKQYILSLADPETINSVRYGQPLTGVYLETYNNIVNYI